MNESDLKDNLAELIQALCESKGWTLSRLRVGPPLSGEAGPFAGLPETTLVTVFVVVPGRGTVWAKYPVPPDVELYSSMHGFIAKGLLRLVEWQAEAESKVEQLRVARQSMEGQTHE